MEISIEHLSKNYGRHKVLEDVTLSIPQGMFGLLGGNGSGKTTLMRILATVLDPTGGRVRINGVDLKEKRDIRRIVGYLPQEFSMYPRMSGFGLSGPFGGASGQGAPGADPGAIGAGESGAGEK